MESKPGQGTVFRIYLPRVSDQLTEVTQQADLSASEYPGGTETILVVEDEDAVRNLMVRVLRASGYTVLDAANARQALPLGEHYDGPIDLFVADVVLPGMKAPQLAKRLKAARPGMQVLYISGHGDQALEEADVHEVLLVKPFSIERLMVEIRRLLDRVDRPACSPN